jgi:anti-sigma B factor antagonist
MFVGDRVAPDGFRADVLRAGHGVLVSVQGELDMATAPAFRSAVDGLEEMGRAAEVTIDLSQLVFIDAAGVGALVRVRNAVTGAGGRLRVRSPRPNILRVLELAGVVHLLDA